jgi:hypothetical protein
MVDAHDSLGRARVTQRLTTGPPPTCGAGCFTPSGMPRIGAMHKPPPSEPPILPGRQRDDALGRLPGIGPRGLQRQARGSKVIELPLAWGVWWRQGVQGTWPCGPCCRRSAPFSRLAHPCPAQAGLLGQPWQRGKPVALLGCGGSSLHHRWERMGGVCERVLSAGRCGWGEGGGSATARVILQTLGARACPCRAPGRHGDARALRGRGHRVEGRACGTQQQTLGAAPSAECGLLWPRLCSACTLRVGHRRPISHDHPRIRSWGIRHETSFDVDEVWYQHCVKKLLVGYLY